MTSQQNGSPSNGEKLAKVLGNLNWPTVVLIALTGGGNWLATLQNRSQIDYSRERVFRQVQDLHDSLEEFERRQKTSLEGIQISLKNQTEMLGNQKQILEELHKKSP